MQSNKSLDVLSMNLNKDQKSQTNLASQNSIQVLQNRAIRKICFKKPNEAVSGDFKKFGILKFHDLIKLQNCIFICQLEQDEQLAKNFATLKHCGDSHNY